MEIATNRGLLETGWAGTLNLRLLIKASGVKPVSIMKTLSGTLAFVALTVIAIGTLPSCHREQVSEECPIDKKFCLKFGGPTDNDYADVDIPKFNAALCALKADQYNVRFRATASSTPIPQYVPPCGTASINTDKITTSQAAKNAVAGESAANDPNATYRVYSNNKADIENVLKTFITPTPPPTL